MSADYRLPAEPGYGGVGKRNRTRGREYLVGAG